MNEQQYMPTRPYFQLNAAEMSALEREAAQLQRVIADPATAWPDRNNAEVRLAEVERLLKAAGVKATTHEEATPPQAAEPKQPAGESATTITPPPGYRAISEHPDGTGAILITPIRRAGS